MWGLAAAFGPVGWVVAAVGTATTVYAATSTNGDKGEKETEVSKKTKVVNNNKIHENIKVYKSKQVKRFKNKYDVDIKFYGATSTNDALKESPETMLSEKISICKDNKTDNLSILERETEEIVKLIEKLEVKKHDATN